MAQEADGNGDGCGLGGRWLVHAFRRHGLADGHSWQCQWEPRKFTCLFQAADCIRVRQALQVRACTMTLN